MRLRFALGMLLAVAMPLFLSAPAAAGGWAVTTLDELPAGGIQAGTTYQLGYTIRQHGVTPFTGTRTEIRARSTSSGEVVVFPGVEGKSPGKYLVDVGFPSAGEWTWEVVQGPFGIQPLGIISVQPAAAERVSPVPSEFSLGWSAVGAATLALAWWGLFSFSRRRSGTAAPRIAGGAD